MPRFSLSKRSVPKMRVVCAFWDEPVNGIYLDCSCGATIEHPTRISLVQCPKCWIRVLWHDVEPRKGIWDFDVAELLLVSNPELVYLPNGVRKYPKAKGDKMNGITDVAGDQNLIGFEPKSPPQLRVVTGDKMDPPENWLHNLKVGSVFFAKDKKDSTSAFCQCFELEQKFEKVVKLIQYFPDGREMELYVISLYFSRLFDYIEEY